MLYIYMCVCVCLYICFVEVHSACLYYFWLFSCVTYPSCKSCISCIDRNLQPMGMNLYISIFVCLYLYVLYRIVHIGTVGRYDCSGQVHMQRPPTEYYMSKITTSNGLTPFNIDKFLSIFMLFLTLNFFFSIVQGRFHQAGFQNIDWRRRRKRKGWMILQEVIKRLKYYILVLLYIHVYIYIILY